MCQEIEAAMVFDGHRGIKIAKKTSKDLDFKLI